jgi:hypothetical protein
VFKAYPLNVHVLKPFIDFIIFVGQKKSKKSKFNYNEFYTRS